MARMGRRRFAGAVAGAASVLVAGCSGNVPGTGESRPPPLDEVEVRLVDVRKPDAGLTSATLPFIVGFSNPTDRKIPSISGDFDVFLDGTRIGSDEPVVNALEPGEETMYDMSIIVEYADVGSALVDAVKSGQFDVSIHGELNAGGVSRTVNVQASV